MSDFSIRQGETLRVTIDVDNDAVSVKMDINTVPMITQTGTFTDQSCELAFTPEQTNTAVGSYDYMLTVTLANGDVEKMPDGDCMYGNCDFPQIIICESIGVTS